MHDRTSNRYILEAIDPVTASISREVGFTIKDLPELLAVLEWAEDEFKLGWTYYPDTAVVARLKRHYKITFDDDGFECALRPWNPNDDLPYKIHTGRELAMMLAKTKPLAVFCDDYPRHHCLEIIPEREFEPHVIAGHIIKHELILPPAKDAPVINGKPIGSRRVLYALPGQEWRIDAYLQLWETMKKTGWTEALEREEGTLLGYEDWQTEIHMKGWRRPAPRLPNS
jgi:hypothetical protein